MESGWLVNSILSKSEESAAALPGRSYQISPIAPPSWRALLQGRKSKMPQGFGRAHVRASSIVITLHISTEKTLFERSAASKSVNPAPAARTGLAGYGDAQVASVRQGEGG